MSKHTPGPWTVKAEPTWGGGREVWNPATEYHVGCAYDINNKTENEANASLIAAAPELLEALIWMVENDETNEGDTPMPDHYGQTWNEINAYWLEGLNKARAAIRKATGEGA